MGCANQPRPIADGKHPLAVRALLRSEPILSPR